MAPILDQSAINTRSVDQRSSAGRRSDSDQQQQFGDVLSNVGGKSASQGRDASATPESTAADQKSRAGRHASDDDSMNPQGGAQSNLLVATNAPIDLTTLAAEIAGTLQTAVAPTPTKTSIAPPQLGSVGTNANLPSAPSVAISDVTLQTHIDSRGPVSETMVAASPSLMAASFKTDTDPKSNTTKAGSAIPTISGTATAAFVTKAEGADGKGQESGSGSPSFEGKDSPTSAKTSKVEEIPASEPLQKADATTVGPMILIPAGTTPTQAVTKAVSETLVQHSSTAPASDTVTTTTIAPPRTLTLQLTPAGMGTVSVTMHAIGHSLDLQLAVSNSDTLGTINRDRDALAKSVSDQGYDLRTLVIQGKDGANVSSDNTGRGQSQTNAHAQSGSDRQSDQNRGSSQSQRPQPFRGNPSNEPPTAPARPRADALFV